MADVVILFMSLFFNRSWYVPVSVCVCVCVCVHVCVCLYSSLGAHADNIPQHLTLHA